MVVQPAGIAGQRDRLNANTAVCYTVTSPSQPMHILSDLSEGQADNGSNYYALLTVMGM